MERMGGAPKTAHYQASSTTSLSEQEQGGHSQEIYSLDEEKELRDGAKAFTSSGEDNDDRRKETERYRVRLKNKGTQKGTEEQVSLFDPQKTQRETERIHKKASGTGCIKVTEWWTADEWKQDMRARQEKDVDLRTMIEYIEDGVTPDCAIQRMTLATTHKYVMKDGVLYKINEAKQLPEESWIQLCVPRESQAKLVEQMHVTMGHATADTLYRVLRQRYYWERMHKECTVHVKYCDACQRYLAPAPRVGKVGFTQLTQEAGCPGQALQIDVIGPYGSRSQQTPRGNRAALVIQDEFTRFVQIYPAASVDAEFVGKALQEWASYMGHPEEVKTDRASYLLAKGLLQYHAAAGTKARTSASLRPQSHGKVEKVNSFIHSRLRVTLAGATKNWDEHTKAAAHAWNRTPRVSLGWRSPHWLMYGRRPYNAFEQEYGFRPVDELHSRASWVNVAVADIKREREAHAESMIQYKTEMLQQARDRWKQKAPVEYQDGDDVKIHLAVVPSGKGMARKLMGRWAVGYTIDGRAGPQTYRVKRKYAGPNDKSTPIHVERIMPYYTTNSTGLTPRTMLEDWNQNDLAAVTEDQADAILGVGDSTAELDKDDVRRLRESLQDEAPTTMRQGWDVPLALDERGISLAETGNEKSVREQLSPPDGHKELEGDNEKLAQREAFRHGPEEDAITQDHGGDGDNAKDKGDTNDESNSGEEGEQLFASYKLTRQRTLADIANDLGMTKKKGDKSKKKDGAQTLIDLNEGLFYTKLTKHKTLKTGTIIRVSKRMRATWKLPKQMAVMARRLKDIGEWDQEFVIESIVGSKNERGKTWYKVKWSAKQCVSGEKTEQWVEDGSITARFLIQDFRDKEIRRKNKEHQILSIERVHAARVNHMGDITAFLTTTTDDQEQWQHCTSKAEIPLEATVLVKPGMTSAIVWRKSADRSGKTRDNVQDYAGMQIRAHEDGWCNIKDRVRSTRPDRDEERQEDIQEIVEDTSSEEDVISGEESDAEDQEDDDDGWFTTSAVTEADDKEGSQEALNPECGEQYVLQGWDAGHGVEDAQIAREVEYQWNKAIKQGLKAKTVNVEAVADQLDPATTIRMMKATVRAGVGQWVTTPETLDATREAARQMNLEVNAQRLTPQGRAAPVSEKTTRETATRETTRPEGPGTLRQLQQNDVDLKRLNVTERIGNTARSLQDVAEAIKNNTSLEILEISGLQGGKDHLVTVLGDILQAPGCCIWAIDLGEVNDIPTDQWRRLQGAMRNTKVVTVKVTPGTERERRKDCLDTMRQNKRQAEADHEENSKWNLAHNPSNWRSVHSCRAYLWNPATHTCNQGIPGRETREQATRRPARSTEQRTIKLSIILWCYKEDGQAEIMPLTKDRSEPISIILPQEDTPDCKTKRRIRETAKQTILALPEHGANIWQHSMEDPGGNIVWSRSNETVYYNRLITSKHQQDNIKRWVPWGQWQTWQEVGLPAEDQERIMTRREASDGNRRWTSQIKPSWPVVATTSIDEAGDSVGGLEATRMLRRGEVVTNVATDTQHMTLGECTQSRTVDQSSRCWGYNTAKGEYIVCVNGMAAPQITIVEHTQANCTMSHKGEVRVNRHVIKKGEAILVARDRNFTTIKARTGMEEEPILTSGENTMWGGMRQWQENAEERIKKEGPITVNLLLEGWRCAWTIAYRTWKVCQEYHGEPPTGTTKMLMQYMERQHGDMGEWEARVNALRDLCSDTEEWKNSQIGAKRSLQLTSEAVCEMIEEQESTQISAIKTVKSMWALMTAAKLQGEVLAMETKVGYSLGGKGITLQQEEELDEKLQTSTVSDVEQALEYVSLYRQRNGTNLHRANTDRQVCKRMAHSINILKDKADKAKEREVEMVKGVDLRWGPSFEHDGKVTIILKPGHLATPRALPVVDSDVKIKYKQEGQDMKLSGTVIRIDPAADGSKTLNVKVGKPPSDIPDADKGDVGAMWRGATFQRTKKAIDDVMGPDQPPKKNVRELREVILGRGTNKYVQPSVMQHLSEWTSSRGLSPSQALAIDNSLRRRVSVIRGPPGTGKSSTIVELVAMTIHAYRKAGGTKKILVVAPTNNTTQDLVCKLAETVMPEKGRPLDTSWLVSRSFSTQVTEVAEPNTVNSKAVSKRPVSVGTGDLRHWERLRRLHTKMNKPQVLTYSEEKDYKAMHKKMVKRVVDESEVIIGTPTQAGLKVLEDKTFGLAIIDEAGLVEELLAYIVMALGPDQLVLVGDENQMKARQAAAEVEKLGVMPIFHRAVQDLSLNPATLVEHWRTSEMGIRPVNQTFYKGLLTVDPDVSRAREADLTRWDFLKDPRKPMMWIDCEGSERKEPGENSTRNDEEARACAEAARLVVQKSKGGVLPKDIAIVVSYKAQVDAVTKALTRKGPGSDAEIGLDLHGVAVGTTDKWQGGERKVIIVSTTRTRRNLKGDFIADPGRLCVMMSRHTHACIVIGSKAAMGSVSEKWSTMIAECEAVGGELTAELPIIAAMTKAVVPMMGGKAQGKEMNGTRQLMRWIRVATKYRQAETEDLLMVYGMSWGSSMGADEDKGKQAVANLEWLAATQRTTVIPSEERTARINEQRRELCGKGQLLGSMLFAKHAEDEIRKWTRETPPTAKDVTARDPFGKESRLTENDLALEAEKEGLPGIEGITNGHKALALSLGAGEQATSDWVSAETRATVSGEVRNMCEGDRRRIWSLYCEAFTTKPDLTNAWATKKFERQLRGLRQGFRGLCSTNIADVESLLMDQPQARIDSVTRLVGDKLAHLQQTADEWHAAVVWIRAQRHLARLWQGRTRLQRLIGTGKAFKREPGEIQKQEKPDTKLEDWDIGLWQRMVITTGVQENNLNWFDEKDDKGRLQERQQVRDAVTAEWHRIHGVPKNKSHKMSYHRWLLRPYEDDFRWNVMLIQPEHSVATIDQGEAVSRAWRIQELAEDEMTQREGTTFLDRQSGRRIGFKHTNRNGLQWLLDRHGKACGAREITGKPYTIRSAGHEETDDLMGLQDEGEAEAGPGETRPTVRDVKRDSSDNPTEDISQPPSPEGNEEENSSEAKADRAKNAAEVEEETMAEGLMIEEAFEAATMAIAAGNERKHLASFVQRFQLATEARQRSAALSKIQQEVKDHLEEHATEADVVTLGAQATGPEAKTNVGTGEEDLRAAQTKQRRQQESEEAEATRERVAEMEQRKGLVQEELKESQRTPIQDDSDEEKEASATNPCEMVFTMSGERTREGWRAHIVKDAELWIYQNTVIQYNGVTVFAYCERWAPGEGTETDDFTPATHVEMDKDVVTRVGVTDHYAWMWLQKEPTDGWEEGWIKGEGHAWGGNLEGRRILHPTPRHDRIMGRWVRARAVQGDEWRSTQVVVDNITTEQRTRAWPMSRWIQDLRTQHPTRRLPRVLFANRKIDKSLWDEWSQGLAEYMDVPCETMGMQLKSNSMEATREGKWSGEWPARRFWWPTNGKPEPMVTVMVDTVCRKVAAEKGAPTIVAPRRRRKKTKDTRQE